jgi:hypothetical protein
VCLAYRVDYGASAPSPKYVGNYSPTPGIPATRESVSYG